MEIVFDEQKFKELVLYIASRCQNDIYWGATTLNKQLFFSEFIAFRRYGRPIAGADYMALGHGPVPRRLLPIRAEMIADQDCLLEIRAFQDRIVALREPDLALLSKEELSVVDEVIDTLRDSRAEEVSDLSHKFPGWLAAIKEGEATGEFVSIPYGTALIDQPPHDSHIISEGLALADKYEWPV